jgi:uncharacterized protein YdaL
VPFSVAVIPVHVDSAGGTTRLTDAPELVEALTYMAARGGTLLLHGYTHQYGSAPNPYDGATGTDFEFYRTHLDDGAVVLDGPVPDDSPRWALDRIDAALRVFDEASLPRPAIFEYPHYAGSAADSRAIATRFSTVYQRELFFAGTDAQPDYRHTLGLFFPFVVTDTYGWTVIPENLGYYVPVGHAEGPPHSAAEIVTTARLNRVVRDGVASFFFHPLYDVADLRPIVEGIRAEGYTFVSAGALRRDP